MDEQQNLFHLFYFLNFFWKEETRFHSFYLHVSWIKK